ncbi:MAG: YidC/Oxa1 family membrane protein insertase [Candidatus Paceibacterota bacterium]
MNIFDAIIYQPLFNALVVLYQWLGDFGLAVVALTVLIRLILYPLAAESIRVQKVTALIQPKMKEIQEKYKNEKEKQAMLMMQLWKENKINPLSSFLFLLLQLPILWGLYYVFFNGFKDGSLAMLYGFVANPGTINPLFFGAINLAASFPAFAVAAGILQFAQVKMMMPKAQAEKKDKSQSEQFAAMMQTQALYIFPIFTVVIFWGLPSALGLYWITTSVFSIVQQYFILKNGLSKDGYGASILMSDAGGAVAHK